MPSPFPCSLVIRECSWKKTQIEKKDINFYKALKAGGIKSKFNLKQLIHEPTHVTANYPSVFT